MDGEFGKNIIDHFVSKQSVRHIEMFVETYQFSMMLGLDPIHILKKIQTKTAEFFETLDETKRKITDYFKKTGMDINEFL